MNFLDKVKRKIIFIYRKNICRDPFLLEASRWFRDEGDSTLRLDYPLSANSVVLDLGGYLGDFADDINKKYKCKVYVFEPVSSFYNSCVERFKGNSDIICMNYGLATENARWEIALSDNASSFTQRAKNADVTMVEVRDIVESVRELNVERVDLLKINIEGGEFDILPRIIESGLINSIDNLQIQFHNFVDDADRKRKNIRDALCVTHEEIWNYEFVWESWRLKR
ncbi:FkbM family methyltransferase [Pseudomonas sp. LMG 31766]|uniref:FkbM family methyltransferase n=1 Tax=Pseudomonas chaetocerotis TaxID=2758695 RepID=A0A931GDM5_9PSED|nr:FkbM family methyltransferase [Pseudomonas chaetocerotis]MBZ9664918.1 FkbM family methyltransferase [Pseudomonas chaetocerotis]